MNPGEVKCRRLCWSLSLCLLVSLLSVYPLFTLATGRNAHWQSSDGGIGVPNLSEGRSRCSSLRCRRGEGEGVLTPCHWLAPASWGVSFNHISMLNHCLALFWVKHPPECGDCFLSICSIDVEDIVEASIMHTQIPPL